jgi:hypothetical protein
VTDLSSLSDDQLKALYASAPAAAAPAHDLSKISDDDLKALHASLLAVPMGVGEDVAKSAGTGLLKAGIGAVGAAGDARNLASAATDYIGGKVGASPEAIQGFKDKAYNAAQYLPTTSLLSDAPSSADIQKGIEGVAGQFHKPQTTAGEYAQTAGEFAPAVLGGGEGLLSRLMTRVALPAAASETAGQVTKGTEAEPYARIAGAVAAGGLANALSRAKEVAAPTVEELKANYRSGIDHPDVKAVTIHPDALEDLHDTIRSDLEKRGFRDRRESNTFSDLKELSNASPTMARAAGAPATIDDVESIRKSLGKTAQEVGPDFRPTSDASAASAAVKHIDRFYDNLKQPDLLSGDISKAAPVLKEARANYAAAMRADTIQKKIGNAELAAGTAFAGGNINNATRQALKPLIKNDFAKASGYTDAEKAALKTAANGTLVGNLARMIGKVGPDAGWKGIEHGRTAIATGGASLPFTGATFIAKKIGDASTARNVAKLDEMLRNRSPLAQQTAAAAPVPARQSGGRAALVNALIASQPYRGAHLGPLQMPQGVPAQNQ